MMGARYNHPREGKCEEKAVPSRDAGELEKLRQGAAISGDRSRGSGWIYRRRGAWPPGERELGRLAGGTSY